MVARHRRTTALLSATALIASVLLAGCSAGSSDSASTSSVAAPAQPAEGLGAQAGSAADLDKRAADLDKGAADVDKGTGEVGKNAAAKAPDLAVDQRAIIYTGSITVRVKKVNEQAAAAAAIATGAGGFVGADKRNSTGDGGDATLELRVPAAKFSTVVDQLARLGNEQARGVDTQDVTEETIDLDARIATQQARVNSGRTLLGQAKSLSDLVMLEGEVAKREADLASLTAKKRRLSDLTALSTITAILLGPAAVAREVEESGGFLGGLKNGWHALAASLAVLLTVIGVLLPWVLAIGLPTWGVIWLFRRFGSRRLQLVPVGPAPTQKTETHQPPEAR